MIRIDNSLLQQIGLANLPDAEKNALLRHIYETLEMRVGVRLADQMSNEQLDEFERYFEAKDDAGAFKWLETNFPNYKDIVQEEFDKLKAEVTQSAPQILSSSQSAAAGQGQPAMTQPVPPPAVPPATPIGQPPMPPANPYPASPQPSDPYGPPPPPPAPQPPIAPPPPNNPTFPPQQPPAGPAAPAY
jgi:hypothetical protein